MSNELSTEVQAPIELTEAAAERIRALLKREANASARLRVGVKGGGCSGLEYVLKLDANVRPNDLQLEVRGVPLLIDPKSLPYIRGSVLEYSGQLIGGGFRVTNPNASRTCGCGTSFTPAD